MRVRFALAIVLLVGCSATRNDPEPSGSAGSAGDTGSSASTSGGSGGDTGGQGGLGGLGGQGGGGLPVGETEVFGHSAHTLYRLDPLTKEVTVVGDFEGCNDEEGLI